MIWAVRHFLCVLIAVALVAGGGAVRPASATAPMAAMPCAMMASPMAAAHARPAMPCRMADGHCLSDLGCVVSAGLPARLIVAAPALPSLSVSYWSAWSKLAGLARQPEPLPPRTA